MVEKQLFGVLTTGESVERYRLINANGMSLEVIPYGCRIIRLLTKDKEGILGDVVLGHATLEEYFGANFQGSTIGRYGNRIANAQFILDGRVISLTKNDGDNSLHGGPEGFHQVLWQVEETNDGDEPNILFSYVSSDGEEGFPGNLHVNVRYTLARDNALVIEYYANTDKNTIFNPTNHSFFNLSGNYQKDVLNTELMINASKVTEVGSDLIPTGKLLDVNDTPLDYRLAKPLGRDMFSNEPSIRACGGFDHNYCVDGEGYRKIAEAYEPESGRLMTVFSDLPGVQLYTFNQASGKNKDGSLMQPHTSFCLETQYYPDSPNQPNFPSCVLGAEENFFSKTSYVFSVR